METIVRRCAGLDVHKESVVACARVIDDNGELQLSTQTFGTTVSDLLVLGDWLASHGVTLVGMESTGVLLETGVHAAGNGVRVLAAHCRFCWWLWRRFKR
jgi:transposase